MALRITGGEFSGRRLKTGDFPELRPTSERVREAVMSALGSLCDLEGARVLDLYAGSGALGIEALSRGAESCLFVEKNKKTAAFLEENLGLLSLGARAKVLCSDAFSALSLIEAEEGFDLIFSDPPYEQDVCRDLLEALSNSPLTKQGAVFVFEAEAKRELNFEGISGAKLLKSKKYGDTQVVFFSLL